MDDFQINSEEGKYHVVKTKRSYFFYIKSLFDTDNSRVKNKEGLILKFRSD